MSDRLKEIIEENRSAFDIYSTDIDEHWPEIEKGIIRRQKTNDLKWVWRVAAAFVIGVGLTVLVNYMGQTSYSGDELAYQISPEWQETEQFYALKINEKMDAIRSSNIDLDPLILEDMNLLDKAYSELKYDLTDGADNEEVINAMISNYQIKLKILEKILLEINEKEENGVEENFEL